VGGVDDPVDLLGAEHAGVHVRECAAERDPPRTDMVEEARDPHGIGRAIEPLLELPRAFDRPGELWPGVEEVEHLVDPRLAFGRDVVGRRGEADVEVGQLDDVNRVDHRPCGHDPGRDDREPEEEHEDRPARSRGDAPVGAGSVRHGFSGASGLEERATFPL